MMKFTRRTDSITVAYLYIKRYVKSYKVTQKLQDYIQQLTQSCNEKKCAFGSE